MATNFQPRSDIKVAIGSGSANLGTAHVAGDTWDFLQVVDFNIEQASAPVDVAPSRNGIYGQVKNQGHHRPDTQMYEISLTMRGTVTAVTKTCLALFGDSSSPLSLTPSVSSGSMVDGASHASAVTLLFENAGARDNASNIDVVIAGCFCTSMVLREDVGTNGGELVVEATFMSAYRPVETALAPDSGGTLDTGVPKNIFDLATSTINSQALIVNNFEISIVRPLERVHFQNTTNYNPYGYVQNGPYEVTGSIVCKRDDSIYALDTQIKGDSTPVALSLAESSGFTIACDKILIDNSKPEMGDFMLQTIPFRAFADSESDNIINITIS
jgi:hypothetical protein